MEFQVKCVLEENVLSQKTNKYYNRVILKFGDFEKMVVLSNLEYLNLKEKLNIK